MKNTYAPELPPGEYKIALAEKLPNNATARMVIGPNKKRYIAWTCSDGKIDSELPLYDAPLWVWTLVQQAENGGALHTELATYVDKVDKMLKGIMDKADDKILRETHTLLKNHLAS